MCHLVHFSNAIADFALLYRILYRSSLRFPDNANVRAFLRDVKASCLKSLSLQRRLSVILNSVRVVWTTGVRRNRVPCFEKGLTADTFAYIRIYLFCTLSSLTLARSTSADRFDEAFVSTLGCVCGLHFDGRTIDSL